MKNLKIWNFLSIVALLSLVASGAWAYNYNDVTNVECVSGNLLRAGLDRSYRLLRTYTNTLGANLSGSLVYHFYQLEPR